MSWFDDGTGGLGGNGMTSVGNGENLWQAVSEAVVGIMEFEKEWDQNKLEKKIREYFNKAAKNMNVTNARLFECINEYADNVFSSLFAGLGDREWLFSGQADFILVLDAGIKDNFPPHLISKIPQAEFEQMVLAAHDRAFEEQRFGPLLTEAMNGVVSGPKTKKRVWNAVEQGRKDAASSAVNHEDFTAHWINRTIELLSEAMHGEPEACLAADSAGQLFHALVEGGGLPLAMTQESGLPPEGWPLVDEAIQTAYLTHTVPYDDSSGGGQTAPAPVAVAPSYGLKGNKGGWGPAGGAPAFSHGPYSKGVGKAKFAAW
jgi:hypothetical protein